jgi:hypothetical protein
VRNAVIILTGEHLRITLGVLALVALAVMLIRDRAQVAAPVPVAVGVGGPSDALPEEPKRTLFSLMATRIHTMLESGFAWPAFVVGLMSTFPPLEGPMALTVIMGSRADAGTQFVAFIVFILLVLVFIEVPLVSYLAAPQKTQAVMLVMNGWITAHRRQIIETMLAVMGIASLVQGISSL